MKKKKEYWYTENKGKLEIIATFNYTDRGLEELNRKHFQMGIAVDKKGKRYNIFSYPCGADCCCACIAYEVEGQLNI